jgi:hypothetical protein
MAPQFLTQFVTQFAKKREFDDNVFMAMSMISLELWRSA